MTGVVGLGVGVGHQSGSPFGLSGLGAAKVAVLTGSGARGLEVGAI